MSGCRGKVPFPSACWSPPLRVIEVWAETVKGKRSRRWGNRTGSCICTKTGVSNSRVGQGFKESKEGGGREVGYMQSCEGPFWREVQLLDLNAQDLRTRFRHLLCQLALACHRSPLESGALSPEILPPSYPQLHHPEGTTAAQPHSHHAYTCMPIHIWRWRGVSDLGEGGEQGPF